jgi:hypothetical protein
MAREKGFTTLYFNLRPSFIMVASLVYDFDFMTSCVCLVFFLFGSEERLWYSVIFARVLQKMCFFISGLTAMAVTCIMSLYNIITSGARRDRRPECRKRIWD